MELNDWSGVLVYVECIGREVTAVSRELLSEAGRLVKQNGDPIYAVAVGANPEGLTEQLGCFDINKLYYYHTTAEFQANLFEQAVTQCINILRPAIVLIGGTARGRALAPRVAVAFKTGLTADCTQLELDEMGRLVQTRPAFGGNIMASILTEAARPQIATVRPGIFPAAETAKQDGEMTVHVEELGGDKVPVVLLAQSDIEQKAGIDQQEILVAAGRGVKRKEDLKMLRELAGLLGGRLASSRALVEKGWMKPEEQIGLSGTTVAPKCLLTFGVSGTVQFMAGMKNTPNIIAVNLDSEAKIFEIAHVPICADLYEVVPELIRILKGIPPAADSRRVKGE